MKRIVATLAAFLFLPLMLVGFAAAPASAGTCSLGGLLCGRISHYSPDANYDRDIKIRCDFGDADTNHLLAEGESSTKYCKDTDQVYIRTGEELWCLHYIPNEYGSGYDRVWLKGMDTTGWHKISDDLHEWGNSHGCTLRVD